MERRALLAATGLALAGGCTGTPADDPGSNDSKNDTSAMTNEASSDTPTTPDGRMVPIIAGYWLDELPDDVDPYPSDEEPLRSNDALQDFLHEVVAQDVREDTEDDASGGKGEAVAREVSEGTMNEIVDDLEEAKSTTDGSYSGYYVENDDRYVRITVENQYRPYNEDEQ